MSERGGASSARKRRAPSRRAERASHATRQRFSWSRAATRLPFAALGFVAALGWALATRHDVWPVWGFVSLLYGVFLSVAGSWIAAHLARRQGQPEPGGLAQEIRVTLTILALVAAAWVWLTPLMKPVVGWWLSMPAQWRMY